ncbi:hypothetical protein MTR67_030616 [Solanum verrucosum]|uniref:Uncharacterized protein n=1 Tax=Solanum verrucosum TaxID=315347 RepID=A0AAF0R7X8_SOLVR|nr:hypothetical protein MTR67_030616 [Solanum verrucosum]
MHQFPVRCSCSLMMLVFFDDPDFFYGVMGMHFHVCFQVLGSMRCKWFYMKKCLALVFVVGEDTSVPSDLLGDMDFVSFVLKWSLLLVLVVGSYKAMNYSIYRGVLFGHYVEPFLVFVQMLMFLDDPIDEIPGA